MPYMPYMIGIALFPTSLRMRGRIDPHCLIYGQNKTNTVRGGFRPALFLHQGGNPVGNLRFHKTQHKLLLLVDGNP